MTAFAGQVVPLRAVQRRKTTGSGIRPTHGPLCPAALYTAD